MFPHAGSDLLVCARPARRGVHGLAFAGSIEPATFEERPTVVRVFDDAGDPVERFTLRLVDGEVYEDAARVELSNCRVTSSGTGTLVTPSRR